MSESHHGPSLRRTGVSCCADGSVQWRLWAPCAHEVTLVLIDGGKRRELTMTSEPRGYHCALVAGVEEGQRYAFRLDRGPERADPCSLWQPEGVDGPSAVFFPNRHGTTDHSWQGVRLGDLVFYEVHVGTFTPEGTFEAIIPRLEALRELGITAVEIMPVSQFPGSRNWGYDGVFPYAAQNTYGGPRGLQRLVEACHRAGLAIYLDVVYNHFGPEGNYLGEFGPYFTATHKTPWGDAINYDRAGCDAVRDFVLDNVRMWLEEFQLDGLRLDATDTIVDMGPRHILRAIKETADDAGARRGWPAIVIAESDANDPRLLYPETRGGYGLDAQWMDDFHHAIHAFFTGERHHYYRDFGHPEQLAEVFRHAYVYDGVYSAFRDRKHGAPASGLNPDRFVVCLQNHDQVGNRASGERLGSLLNGWAQQRLAASIFLLSPYLPLIFMGQEYGETRPFPFFCSYQSEELARAVREGRRREFSGWDENALVPDPGSIATFSSTVLTWSWPEGSPHSGLRRLYRDLLTARREWPSFRNPSFRSAHLITDASGAHLLHLKQGTEKGTDPFTAAVHNSEAPRKKGTDPFNRRASADRALKKASVPFSSEWQATEGGMEKASVPFSGYADAEGAPEEIEVYFNLEGRSQALSLDGAEDLILRFSSEAEGYGGCRNLSRPIREIFAFECLVFAQGPRGPSG